MKIKQIFIFLFISWGAYSQFYRGYDMPFGRSRVQYAQQFIWNQWRTSLFDVFYYQGGKKLAEYVINSAKNEIKDISSFFNYLPEKKFFFILYNNKEDFLASNVGYTSDEGINSGGATKVVDYKIVLYFDGDHEHLRKQIREGLARVFLQTYLYGENLSSNVRRNQTLVVPSWFTEGLVDYLANGWNVYDEYRLKQLFEQTKKFSFHQYNLNNSTLMGKAFWNYLIEMHGAQTVPAALSMLEVTKNVTSALLFVYGKKIKQLRQDCEAYYQKKWQDWPQNIFSTNIEQIFKKKYFVFNHSINPDGTKMLYVTDKWDKKKLWLYDFSSHKKKKIYVTGKKWDLSFYRHYPLTAWHPNGKIIAWIGEEKQKRFLFIRNLEENSTEKFNIEQFTYVNSMSFSPDGLSILLTAVLDGQTDLFLFYPGSNAIKRLSNDLYDEKDARFSPNGKWIAYTSNKPMITPPSNEKIFFNKTFDVFLKNVGTQQELRVTNTILTNERKITWTDDGRFLFLSDTGGFDHVFSAKLDSAIQYVDTIIHYRYFFRVSPILHTTCKVDDWDMQKKQFVFLIDHGKKKKQYVFKQDEIIPTSFKELWTSNVNPPNIEVNKEKIKMQSYLEPKKLDTNFVDIYNFQFKTLKKRQTVSDTTVQKQNASTIGSKDSLKDTLVVSRPQNYNVEYSIQKVVTQFTLDKIADSYLPFSANISNISLSPLSGFIKLGATDVLENNRIIGGVKLSGNFKENEYVLAYENYRTRLDKILAFHYFNKYYQSQEGLVERHQLSNVWFGAAYSIYSLLTWRNYVQFRYDKISFGSYDLLGLLMKDKSKYWGSIRTELTYDNTITLTTNILQGWRWKIFSEYYQGFHNQKLNLITIGFDVRVYLPWYKSMISAHRIAWGSSFGKTRLMYFLGGTNQTLFSKFDTHNPFDTTYHYEFLAVATNLRGLPVNCRNGNTFFVINNEWRFPIFQVLLRAPLAWGFINHLQFIAFNDIGSAYVGLNPFSEKNTYFNQFIYQKPFTIQLQKYRFPIVMGNGIGLRTTLWEYFIRLDIAWGWDNYRFSKPVYLISLGTDF